jgi:UPF0271 protein
VEIVVRRGVRMAVEGRITATDGSELDLRIDTICVHGDTPGSVELARALRMALERAGVSVRRFSRPVR